MSEIQADTLVLGAGRCSGVGGNRAADYRTVLSSGARGQLAVLFETAFDTRIILVVIRKRFCIQAIAVGLS